MLSSFALDFEKHPKLQFRIDSFSVPTATRADFEAAMRRNLDFIRTSPGFLGHLVFQKAGGPSNRDIITIAVWQSPEAIEKATVAVRQYYTQIGFDPAEATARGGVLKLRSASTRNSKEPSE